MTAPKASQATTLVHLARETYRFGRSLTGEPFAVKRGGPNVAHLLRGGMASLRPALAASFASEYRKAPSQAALADALMVLEGAALTAKPERLHLRLAAYEDGIVLDLADDSGRCLMVRPSGWSLCDVSPVLFQRTALTRALPEPERGGTIEELRHLLNVSDESWPLVLGWLLAAIVPDIPHPLLLLSGEQGTAKSSAARLLSLLVDPSAAPLRSAPRDLDTWAVAANGSWVVALDNISSIPDWLSDALCRAVTGEGLVKRRLYANDDLVVLSFKRVVALTAIDAGALRGDLADRLLMVELDRIAPAHRRTAAAIESAFTVAHSRVLGALLDLLVQVLAALAHVQMSSAPRMADFARVLAALDLVAGTEALRTYTGQAAQIAEEVVEGDLVAQAVLTFVRSHQSWSGTAADLLDNLTPDRPPKGWPGAPHHLSRQLRRSAPALRQLGVDVDVGRSGKRRQWVLSLAQPGDANGDANTHLASPGSHLASPSVTQTRPNPNSESPTGDANDANDAKKHPFSVVVKRKERGPEMTRNLASLASLASPVGLLGEPFHPTLATHETSESLPPSRKRCPEGHRCNQPPSGSLVCCGQPEAGS